ncbi:MAG: hypothetical protein HC842_01730, partial [Cytophagales bacterium]|nr:hypothetical protein [Cytophagales bacterium]
MNQAKALIHLICQYLAQRHTALLTMSYSETIGHEDDSLDAFLDQVKSVLNEREVLALDYNIQHFQLKAVAQNHECFALFPANFPRMPGLFVTRQGSGYLVEDLETGERRSIAGLSEYLTGLWGRGVVKVLSFEYLGSLFQEEERGAGHGLNPVKRLFRLLAPDRKEIFAIYAYAILYGLIGLVLPLGIQGIVSLVSGGIMFNSIIFLIIVVVVAIMVSGGIQIMQMTLVENLQRRVFTKAAFEFTFRI